MDDNIAQFTALTSADPARAAQYLQLTDNHLEQALSLYFESPNLDLGPTEPQPSAAQPTQGPSHVAGGSEHPIEIDSDDDMSDHPTAQKSSSNAAAAHNTTVEDDEAMARRLQEEFYGGAGGPASGAGVEPEVRAPMARTTETLVGPGASWGGDDLDAAVAEQLLARQRRAAGRKMLLGQVVDGRKELTKCRCRDI